MGPHELYWWIGAGVLIVAELTTGTFYLLMIALGFIAGALAGMANLRLDWQCMIAAVVALVAVYALRRSRFGRRKRNDAAHNPDVNLDIGETRWRSMAGKMAVHAPCIVARNGMLNWLPANLNMHRFTGSSP